MTKWLILAAIVALVYWQRAAIFGRVREYSWQDAEAGGTGVKE